MKAVKLNLPKPLVKYLSIALSALVVFLLVYTYVKLTNDRVYDFAHEQVVQNDIKPEHIRETLKEPTTLPPEAKASLGSKVLHAGTHMNTNSVDLKTTEKIFIAGKSAHTCMQELNTTVINNDVVKCTRDHYIK